MEIFPIFQHKVEGTPHFARLSEVRHIYIEIIVSLCAILARGIIQIKQNINKVYVSKYNIGKKFKCEND